MSVARPAKPINATTLSAVMTETPPSRLPTNGLLRIRSRQA
jgi:hypothetical protein